MKAPLRLRCSAHARASYGQSRAQRPRQVTTDEGKRKQVRFCPHRAPRPERQTGMAHAHAVVAEVRQMMATTTFTVRDMLGRGGYGQVRHCSVLRLRSPALRRALPDA